MRAVRCDRIEHLTDRDFLSTLVGPVCAVERASMGTLDSPEVAEAWDVFASPYVAFAADAGEVALLMHDLSPHLLPDVREPVAIASEDAILLRLARLHARYWGRPLPDWLARPTHLFSVIGPAVVSRDPGPALPVAFGQRVIEGWTEAFRRLPVAAAATLRASAADHEQRFGHLPYTLIHGDAKVANFAFLLGDKVAAFDWAVAGRAPAGIELGWYLAVNASRLARSKEAVIERYRALLETALGRPLAQGQWVEMQAAAFLGGALMLLWSKALALREGRDGAQAEWDWWVERIPTDRNP